MMKKRILAILLTVMLMVGVLTVSALAADVAYPTSGKCGDDAYWEYDEDSRTLIISGTGRARYSWSDFDPFFVFLSNFFDEICIIRVEEGITEFKNEYGTFCLYNMPNLTDVYIPASMVEFVVYEDMWRERVRYWIDEGNPKYFNDEFGAVYERPEIYHQNDGISTPTGRYEQNDFILLSVPKNLLTYNVLEGTRMIHTDAIVGEPSISIPESVSRIEYSIIRNATEVNVPGIGYEIYYLGTEEQWNSQVEIFDTNSYVIKLWEGRTGYYDDYSGEFIPVGYQYNIHFEARCLLDGHTAVAEIPETPATCEDVGMTAKLVCSGCGALIQDCEEIPALGHEYEMTVLNVPTCTEYGLAKYICKNDESHFYVDSVDPTGEHSYDVSGKCVECGAADPDYVAPVENPFTDVPNDAWFAKPVLWAKANNVTGGTSATTFGPNDSCTRAQVVTFLWAANGKPEPKSENPFTDVAEDAWYLKPVLWAVEQGITGGVAEGQFGPDQTCTRAQIATFLYAAAGKPEVKGSSIFSDVADGDWFAKPIIWAAENDVTGGIGDGKFGPNNTCTRAQVVTFLYKVYGNK